MSNRGQTGVFGPGRWCAEVSNEPTDINRPDTQRFGTGTRTPNSEPERPENRPQRRLRRRRGLARCNYLWEADEHVPPRLTLRPAPYARPPAACSLPVLRRRCRDGG